MVNISELLPEQPNIFHLNKFLVILLGPTAVGKTALSVKLASHFNSEIISADSRQFYKELVIGTAPPGPEELKTVKHHLIGTLPITEYYNVYRFGQDVSAILEKIFHQYNIAFMVGGSGLYIDAVCKGIDDIPDPDSELRDELNNIFTTSGIQALRDQLKILDPAGYEKIDIANHKRIIRALEVCITTGKPYSSFLKNKVPDRPYNILKIGLRRDREELNHIINKRVDQMIQNGLENEAKMLYPFRHLNSLQTVGYREFFDYFEAKISFEDAIEKIKTNTRRYAKKQMTWFSRDKDISWFHPAEFDSILEFIKTNISSHSKS